MESSQHESWPQPPPAVVGSGSLKIPESVTIDRLEAALTREIAASRARDGALAVAHRNLRDSREQVSALRSELAAAAATIATLEARIRELEAGMGNLESVIRQVEDERDSARRRVVELAPFEVSAKLQLKSLGRTLPAAVAKRVRRSPA